MTVSGGWRRDRRLAQALVVGCLAMTACSTFDDERKWTHGTVPEAQSGPLVNVVTCAQTGPHTVELVVDLINPLPGPAQFSGHVAVTDGQGRAFANSGLGHIGPIGSSSRQRHAETLVREHNDATGARCDPKIDQPQDWAAKLDDHNGVRGRPLAPENIRLTACEGPTAVEFRNPHGPAWNVWAWVERFNAGGASLGAGIAEIWPSLSGAPLWGRETRAVPIDEPRVDRPIVGCRILGAWSVDHEDVPKPIP